MKNLKATIMITLFLASPSVLAQYSGGSGSPDDPWQISCPNDLLYLGSHPDHYSSHFILTSDINLADYTFSTAVIASDTDLSSVGFQGTYFTGSFNGNGFIIHSLTIDTNGQGNDYLGLFGVIATEYTIQNLGIENLNIWSGEFSENIGGLVGDNYGTVINNCCIRGSVIGGDNSMKLGGLAGSNSQGKINNCSASITIISKDFSRYIGGLVGENYGELTNCNTEGTILIGSRSRYLGGLSGDSANVIKDCYSNALISLKNSCDFVGGLIGLNAGTLINCYVTGKITGGSHSGSIGGLCGRNGYAIKNCYSTASVYLGDDSIYIGGFVGLNYNSISNCYSAGEVNLGNNIRYCGGFVGRNLLTGLIKNSFWDIQASGMQNGYGYNNGTITNLMGKITEEMQCQSTFTAYGWDFFGETANGKEDIWRMPMQAGYPILRWQYPYSGGSGSKSEPWKISTADDLLYLALNTEHYESHFVLTNDIDLKDYIFSQAVIAPDLYSYELDFEGTVFDGSFDGCGHIIFNLTIDTNNMRKDYIALFGCIGTKSVIENLGVEEVKIEGGRSSAFVGGLAAKNNGIITKCYATGIINGDNNIESGVLTGFNSGMIRSCYAEGIVKGSSSIGGLAGRNNGTIRDCYSESIVIGGWFLGGFLGYNDRGTISNCYSTGILSIGDYSGGFIGQNYEGSIGNCFWDIQSSGYTNGYGYNMGTITNLLGKTTEQMQIQSTFTNYGWDFAGESTNGTEDIWFIREGLEYPKLYWENNKPVADAGIDQQAYAWIDGFGKVSLDGSASFDEDGDELTYNWMWVIDGSNFDANGINPTIELPAGEHKINLVVNDFLDESEPDDVNVIVIGPIQSQLRILPRVINPQGQMSKIMVTLVLPQGITPEDIDPSFKLRLYADSLEYDDSIEAINQRIYRRDINGAVQTVILAFFDRSDLLAIISSRGKMNLTAAGQLKTGQYFFGTDTVFIIHPSSRKF